MVDKTRLEPKLGLWMLGWRSIGLGVSTELYDWLSLDGTVVISKWGCLSADSYKFSEKWVPHNFLYPLPAF